MGCPTITNDGVSIAKARSKARDPYEKIGAELVKEVAKRPTTWLVTAPPRRPVLAQALVREACATSLPVPTRCGTQGGGIEQGRQRPSAVRAARDGPRRSRPNPRSLPPRPSPRPTLQIGRRSSPRPWTRSAREGVITVEESQTFRPSGLDSPRACASTRATSPPTS